MTIQIQVTGVDQVIANLGIISEKANQAGRVATVRAMDAIMGVSQQRCPRGVTGYLERSHFVDEYDEGELYSVIAGYSAEYAIYVHEMLDPTELGNPVHWTKPGSGPKFLEDPFNESSGNIPSYVANAIKDSLIGGIS